MRRWVDQIAQGIKISDFNGLFHISNVKTRCLLNKKSLLFLSCSSGKATTRDMIKNFNIQVNCL